MEKCAQKECAGGAERRENCPFVNRCVGFVGYHGGDTVWAAIQDDTDRGCSARRIKLYAVGRDGDHVYYTYKDPKGRYVQLSESQIFVCKENAETCCGAISE